MDSRSWRAEGPLAEGSPSIPGVTPEAQADGMSHHIPVGSIVVAVDGSSHAGQAVIWAAEQARRTHRPLVAVTVGEENPAEAIALATEVVRGLAPEVELHTIAVPGHPIDVLVDLSTEAQLVVLGSRGRGTVRSMLLGSVSASVSKHAACPVVVCRPGPAVDERRGVVVGADGTPESLAVLEFAFEQAAMRGHDLTVVHCIWDVVAAVAGLRNVAYEDLDPAAVEEEHVLLAESLAGFAEKYPDVKVSVRVAHGLVDEVLGRHSEEWDLVVVGRHPVDTAGRMVLGAISTAVLERARTTVAVVPETAGDAS